MMQTYWDHRYLAGDTSGAGSYGHPMLQKVAYLKALPGIRTILEIGCGDFNFGKTLLQALPNTQYVGLDISKVIIERNQKLYENLRTIFLQGSGNDYLGRRAYTNIDLLLCIDVLYHEPDEVEYETLLTNLEKNWTKYLALTAYEYEGLKRFHIHIRKFNPERFGVPILREVIEEDGQLYFYIFERGNVNACI